MKIIIDENMPYAKELFGQLGEVIPLSGRTITADDLIDVDGLMIRSVTKVNEELLSKANKLKFVGTATAGYDHLDQAALEAKGVHYTHAPGCNKVGVASMWFLALWYWLKRKAFQSLIKPSVLSAQARWAVILLNACRASGLRYLSTIRRPKQGRYTRVHRLRDPA